MIPLYGRNDGRFPDDSLVLVPYPLDPVSERSAWPWLPGTVLGQCGPNEWHIVLDGRDDLAEPDADGELLYPACFRNADEIRSMGPQEWERHRVTAAPGRGRRRRPSRARRQGLLRAPRRPDRRSRPPARR